MQAKGGITNRYRKIEQERTIIETTEAPALSLIGVSDGAGLG